MFVRATWCDDDKIGSVYGGIKKTGFMALESPISRSDGCLGENCTRFTDMTRGLFVR